MEKLIMTNEFSVEDLISMGTGLSSNKKTVSTSIEGYDGFDDEIFAEVARSEETLNFLDTLSLMQNKCSSDKIKMLKKINANYNSRTIGNGVAANSIESFINTQIYSLEDDGAAAKKPDETTDVKPADKPADDKAAEKKKNFFAKVWEAIKKFFAAIKDAFVKLFGKIKAFFSKNKEAADPKQVEEKVKEIDSKNEAVSPSAAPGSSSGKYFIFNISELQDGKLKNCLKIFDTLAEKVEKMSANNIVTKYSEATDQEISKLNEYTKCTEGQFFEKVFGVKLLDKGIKLKKEIGTYFLQQKLRIVLDYEKLVSFGIRDIERTMKKTEVNMKSQSGADPKQIENCQKIFKAVLQVYSRIQKSIGKMSMFIRDVLVKKDNFNANVGKDKSAQKQVDESKLNNVMRD
jgi:hypothetical protein